jgi:tetratricopeptide (TPR) repeat protein
MGLRLKFEILVVEKLDWYEWNWGQVHYKIHTCKSKGERICPARVPKLKGFKGNYAPNKHRNTNTKKSKMVKFCKILVFFLIPLCSFSQSSDNEELKKMYEEDQNARKMPKINWVELRNSDSLRSKRVYEFIDSGRIVTGKDYYHSAMIFQHGRDSVAYRMAVKQIQKAIELDTTISRWLFAAATDRELMSRDQPQIYGTQYCKMNVPNSKWERYKIDTTQITDKERRSYGVETLAEQVEKEFYMNLASLSDFYQNPNSIEATLDLIRREKKKERLSAYDVRESAVNDLGYELLGLKKLPEAFLIFRLNTELYPLAWNTYDSLGECLLLLGKKKEGIKAYKKSLQLNPNNKTAQKILEKN